jgi:hypothetical protein
MFAFDPRRTAAIAAFSALAACSSNESTTASSKATSTAAPAMTSAAPSNRPPEVNGVAELRDLKIWPDKPVKSHFFVAEMVLAKGAAVRDPMFRVTFKDDAGNAVDSGTCAYRGVIKSDEKAPCYGAIWKATKWSKVDVVFVPGDASLPADHAPLTVSGAELVHGDEVDGQVTNDGKTALEDVNVYIALYGADGKIVGANSAPITGNDLAPGATAKFAVKVDEVQAPAKTFAVKMSP